LNKRNRDELLHLGLGFYLAIEIREEEEGDALEDFHTEDTT
jgi:hypothetical protein